MRSSRIRHIIPLSLALVLASAFPAAAYIGPGAGLSVIGTILALLATLGLAIFGFVWFPLKRLLRQRRATSQRQARSDDARQY